MRSSNSNNAGRRVLAWRWRGMNVAAPSRGCAAWRHQASAQQNYQEEVFSAAATSRPLIVCGAVGKYRSLKAAGINIAPQTSSSVSSNAVRRHGGSRALRRAIAGDAGMM